MSTAHVGFEGWLEPGELRQICSARQAEGLIVFA